MILLEGVDNSKNGYWQARTLLEGVDSSKNGWSNIFGCNEPMVNPANCKAPIEWFGFELNDGKGV